MLYGRWLGPLSSPHAHHAHDGSKAVAHFAREEFSGVVSRAHGDFHPFGTYRRDGGGDPGPCSLLLVHGLRRLLH